MKTSKLFTIAGLFFLLVLVGCDDENDASNSELLQNTSAEDGTSSPAHWLSSSGGAQTIWSDTQSFDGEHSLQLTFDNTNGSAGFWAQLIEDKIPYGKRLILKCKIKLDDITGEGVAIAVRGDNNSAPVFFYTTEGETTIAGNMDWTEFSVEMDEGIPEDVRKIYIFLILLNDSAGTVYFDDISLKRM